MNKQSVKINLTPEVRRKFNKVKEDIKADYPQKKIRSSEALEILIRKYKSRFTD